MKKVIIQHDNGNKYQVFLSPYEIEQAEMDSNFYNEVTDKYNKLYEKNIVQRIEYHDKEVAENKDQQTTNFAEDLNEHHDVEKELDEQHENGNSLFDEFWTEQETLFLISLYAEYQDELKHAKKRNMCGR
ncbi:hypothetical protein QE152_g26955 [Popillia japonica]|uniref:Uncharacterized protein n=1 Tax=Popillia japonica TaxID=7064 RepID=A0AAW1JWW3_POPJA